MSCALRQASQLGCHVAFSVEAFKPDSLSRIPLLTPIAAATIVSAMGMNRTASKEGFWAFPEAPSFFFCMYLYAGSV